MSIREQFGKTPANEGQADNRAIRPAQDEVTDQTKEDPNWEAKHKEWKERQQAACEPAESVDDRPKSAVDENVLQEPTRFDSMSYTNDLTDEDVEKVIELHAEQIRTGFRKKEISAKWLARVLMRSNKTLCERYGRGTSVSEIVSKELSAKSDDLKDRLMELTPSARAKLLAELGIG